VDLFYDKKDPFLKSGNNSNDSSNYPRRQKIPEKDFYYLFRICGIGWNFDLVGSSMGKRIPSKYGA
jgi:hypothetical protein